MTDLRERLIGMRDQWNEALRPETDLEKRLTSLIFLQDCVIQRSMELELEEPADADMERVKRAEAIRLMGEVLEVLTTVQDRRAPSPDPVKRARKVVSIDEEVTPRYSRYVEKRRGVRSSLDLPLRAA